MTEGIAPPPEEFDQGVLMALREAGRVLDRGIDAVSIAAPHDHGATPTIFNQATRESIAGSIRKAEQAWTTAEGRLLMADVKEGSLRCRLHPSVDDAFYCTFDEYMVSTVMRYLRQFVRVRGEATVDPVTNQIRALTIRDIEPVEAATESFVVSTDVFWHAKSFEQLSAEQEVYPVEDWERLSSGWPEDADFDEFLEAVRSARQE
jgi:hypothetical protein